MSKTIPSTGGPSNSQETPISAAENAQHADEPATLDWAIPVAQASSKKIDETRVATPDECQRLINLLPVEDLSDVTVSFQLAPAPGTTGDILLTGTVGADLFQTCSVTLEPMSSRLNEPLRCRFTAASAPDTPPSSESDELSILDIEDVETFENEAIPLGRIVVETLLAGINPYPRKTDETGEWKAGWAVDGGSDSPFAALQQLKGDKPSSS
ncbi:MAG: hypothetical protein AAFO75_01155 [Pseudomonadota bacterium]